MAGQMIDLMGTLKFSSAERHFLEQNEACRVATCRNNVPHVVPVSYLFEKDTFIFATDYGTKKIENIKNNNRVALTVDVYDSVKNKAICVQGSAEIIESGSEFERLYSIFYQRFEWVRKSPWKQGEAPFVRVVPKRKTSWGL
jgi:nitroimidazol reductase NimA-like FMN-containing flavoprotein (pyridoxamine 5'-phosphate oxidase superfamily)